MVPLLSLSATSAREEVPQSRGGGRCIFLRVRLKKTHTLLYCSRGTIFVSQSGPERRKAPWVGLNEKYPGKGSELGKRGARSELAGVWSENAGLDWRGEQSDGLYHRRRKQGSE